MTQQPSSTNKPRIIIMRHSERLDFVLRNPNWPSEVFIDGVYSPNTHQLPTVLPTRKNPHEYLLDTPLSRYGKVHALHTGGFFRSLGVIPNRIYTSPAMRCVQTADSILDGLGIREKRPLRIDLALHEATRKELPLQPAQFFSSADFHIDLKYRPLLPSNGSGSILGETRLQYYRRIYLILKRITKKLTSQTMKISSSESTPTVLIVTHRSCVTLLATMLNLDSVDDKLSYLNEIESNKRGEVNFLSMIIAEYDASNGLWTFLSDFSQISGHPPIQHSN
jgi:ubiquitin-associated SH3 domain-containing protein